MFQERVKSILDAHNASDPLFLYFPLQSVHEPLEVPQYYYDLYPNVKEKDRRTFQGKISVTFSILLKIVVPYSRHLTYLCISIRSRTIKIDTMFF